MGYLAISTENMMGYHVPFFLFFFSVLFFLILSFEYSFLFCDHGFN